MFTIVHRRLLDARRARSRRPPPASLESVAEPVGGDVAEDAGHGLDRGGSSRCSTAFPPDQRTVLLLRILGDMTIEEIARTVGKRPGAVKALQRRGLKRCREGVPLCGRRAMTSV